MRVRVPPPAPSDAARKHHRINAFAMRRSGGTWPDATASRAVGTSLPCGFESRLRHCAGPMVAGYRSHSRGRGFESRRVHIWARSSVWQSAKKPRANLCPAPLDWKNSAIGSAAESSSVGSGFKSRFFHTENCFMNDAAPRGNLGKGRMV